MPAGLLLLSKDRCELATINYRAYTHLALSQIKTTAVGGNLIACSSMAVDRTALCPIRLRLTNDPTRLGTSHKSDNIGHFIHFPNSLQETQVTDQFSSSSPLSFIPALMASVNVPPADIVFTETPYLTPQIATRVLEIEPQLLWQPNKRLSVHQKRFSKRLIS